MYSFNITILGEGHPLSPGWQGPGRYFNPPSPCGEGHSFFVPPSVFFVFQSTLPVWGGTGSGRWRPAPPPGFQSTLPVWGGTSRFSIFSGFCFISIHPPRVGRDKTALTDDGKITDFNPPSPCGEGRVCLAGGRYGYWISIHPPRVGRDHDLFHAGRSPWPISIHPPRVGRDGRISLS